MRFFCRPSVVVQVELRGRIRNAKVTNSEGMRSNSMNNTTGGRVLCSPGLALVQVKRDPGEGCQALLVDICKRECSARKENAESTTKNRSRRC